MNQLINIYQYRDEDVAEYFNKEGAAVAVEIFATVITGSSGQLQNWQNQKPKLRFGIIYPKDLKTTVF